MCAINGTSGSHVETVTRMNACTHERGPDGTAVWAHEKVTLGFNRLAVIDLSERSMQPMHRLGKYSVVFNGEIYNFKELKKELVGFPFESDGDAEVIIAAYAKWGVGAFPKLNGMFALALYDHERDELLLVRDSAGIKPLYYALVNGGLTFSSEIKGMLASGIPPVLNHIALGHYLRLLYVPKIDTLIQGIKNLEAGTLLTFKNGTITIQSFVPTLTYEKPSTYGDAVDLVRTTLMQAVTRQLVSDRPVGVFLSGGLDSSILLSVASAVHPAINTYSMGYALEEGEEPEKFNADAVLAQKTSAHFCATHHEYLLPAGQAATLLRESVRYMSDPVGNATALSQLYLSQQTKPTATVVLSGEGGDELFGGYERYRLALLASYLGPFALHGVDRYAQLMFQKNTEQVLKNPIGAATVDLFRSEFEAGNIVDQLMRVDEKNWLVEEALRRADQMSMAASVELRVPFLDDEVRAVAHALPREWKVGTRTTKKVLRDAFRDALPKELFTQPKRGWFSPGAKWLRRPEFAQLAQEVFDPSYTALSSLIETEKLVALWNAHLSKKSYHYTELWTLLTILMWAKEYNVTV